jgi:hypothetical protein
LLVDVTMLDIGTQAGGKRQHCKSEFHRARMSYE